MGREMRVEDRPRDERKARGGGTSPFPGGTLPAADEAGEDAAHGLEVDALVAVEHQHLPPGGTHRHGERWARGGGVEWGGKGGQRTGGRTVVLRRVFWVDPFNACPRTARGCDQSVETESSVDMGRDAVPPWATPEGCPEGLDRLRLARSRRTGAGRVAPGGSSSETSTELFFAPLF